MDKSVDEIGMKKEGLAKDIIGEIAVSADPPGTIRKWRSLFKVSQKSLAKELGVTSSVISDYETGRRKSPGILFLRRYVEALLSIDERKGGEMLRGFLFIHDEQPASAAIADIREFDNGLEIERFCREMGASIIGGPDHREKKIYGYTIIDSVKAITELSFSELVKLYGVTTQRALIFTNITTGKGPMIAIKVANLRPALVVLHNIQPAEVSDVAKNLAVVEGIPLAVCGNPDLNSIIEKLKHI